MSKATFTAPRGTLKGPGGIYVEFDAREIFPDDPGNGTPVMVRAPFGKGCSTYWCASSEGEIDGKRGPCVLTEDQCRWLDSIENAVDQWLSLWTNAIRRDGRGVVSDAS